MPACAGIYMYICPHMRAYILYMPAYAGILNIFPASKILPAVASIIFEIFPVPFFLLKTAPTDNRTANFGFEISFSYHLITTVETSVMDIICIEVVHLLYIWCLVGQNILKKMGWGETEKVEYLLYIWGLVGLNTTI